MNRRPIRLAVFDMAGTTVDDHGEVYRVLREAVARGGVEVDDAQFDRFRGAEKRSAIAEMLGLAGPPPGPRQVEDSFLWFVRELRRRCTNRPPTPYPGVEAMISGLRARGVSIGLTTGFSREVADPMLEALGWHPDHPSGAQLIDAVVTGDQVPAGRPDPAMILRVMDQLEVTDPSEVMAVGDTPRDIRAARRAGASAVGVLTGGAAAPALRREGADLVLDSAAELADRHGFFIAPSGA